MIDITFKAQVRSQEDRVKKLRKQGFLPANVYGLGKDSISITINATSFENLHDQVGDTGLVYLQVGETEKQLPVLIDEIQIDPISDHVLHVAFKQVDLKDKIKAEVPVEIVGEFDVAEAVLVTVKDSIEVEALPTDFPEKFEVDVSSLTEIGQSILLSDLEYDSKKIELTLGEEGFESPIVLVQELKEEVEEEVVEEEPTDEELKEDEEIDGSDVESAESKSEDKSEKSKDKS